MTERPTGAQRGEDVKSAGTGGGPGAGAGAGSGVGPGAGPGRAVRGKRPTARRELVETEIFEQAARLFAERGFAGTNLGDIAEAMGITRPALYYYVKSKEDLLAKLVEQMTEGPAAEIDALAADGSLDPAERLRRIAHLIAFSRARQPQRFQVLLRSHADLPEEAAQAHRNGQRVALAALMRVIEEGVVQGQFRPVDTRATGLAVAGMCNGVAWWHPGDHSFTPTEAADQVADLAVTMLLRPEARTPQDTGPRGALALLRQDLDYLERILDK